MSTCGSASLLSVSSSPESALVSISQLRGADWGAEIFVNSWMPVLGQTRYRDGLPFRGWGNVTMRASRVAVFGKMNMPGDEPSLGVSVYLEARVAAGVSVDSLAAGLVDLVRGMALVSCDQLGSMA